MRVFTDSSELVDRFREYGRLHQDSVVIHDASGLRHNLVDDLVHTSVFGSGSCPTERALADLGDRPGVGLPARLNPRVLHCWRAQRLGQPDHPGDQRASDDLRRRAHDLPDDAETRCRAGDFRDRPFRDGLHLAAAGRVRDIGAGRGDPGGHTLARCSSRATTSS